MERGAISPVPDCERQSAVAQSSACHWELYKAEAETWFYYIWLHSFSCLKMTFPACSVARFPVQNCLLPISLVLCLPDWSLTFTAGLSPLGQNPHDLRLCRSERRPSKLEHKRRLPCEGQSGHFPPVPASGQPYWSTAVASGLPGTHPLSADEHMQHIKQIKTRTLGTSTALGVRLFMSSISLLILLHKGGLDSQLELDTAVWLGNKLEKIVS